MSHHYKNTKKPVNKTKLASFMHSHNDPRMKRGLNYKVQYITAHLSLSHSKWSVSHFTVITISNETLLMLEEPNFNMYHAPLSNEICLMKYYKALLILMPSNAAEFCNTRDYKRLNIVWNTSVVLLPLISYDNNWVIIWSQHTTSHDDIITRQALLCV